MRFHSLFNVRAIIKLKLFIGIYYTIFQFFLQKRYSEADFVMEVAWKIALYNLVFHQLPLIQHCSIFYKKNTFQSTKNFRRIQWQTMLRMHLLQSRISKFSLVPPPTRNGGTPLSGSPPLAPAVLGSCLRHSTLPLLYKLRLLLQFFLRTLSTQNESFSYFLAYT